MEAALESIKKQFAYYKYLGNKTFAQLDEADFFWQDNPESNSIALIVKHLWGNMLSRWTDIFNTDGEKPWRNRDAEFENDLQTKAAVLQRWEQGWACLEATLNQLKSDDLQRIIYIRNEGHTVLEALYRQLAHYPYHVGQIVFIGKLRKKSTWQSLSIPRQGSKAYNAGKFNVEKQRIHFTDSIINKDK